MSSEKLLPEIKEHHRPVNPESPLHVKHRETARVFLQNSAGELLMMNTHWDPGTGLPPRWLTPGGGIDPGESVLAAAVRELYEETGLVVEPERLGEIELSLPFKMVWEDGRYETGVAHFYRLTLAGFVELDSANWTIDEHRDVIEWRWWKPSELIASGEKVGPPGLAEYLEHHF
jgi:8-oxo-dGTP pyrophosphatase MutT (NUDIX family)